MLDVIIVGGGPAGLYSAFYCGLRGLDVTVVEAQEYLGGKLNVYKEKLIWDIGGVTPMKAGEIIASLEEQSQTFEPKIITGKSVVEIKENQDSVSVVTEDDKEYVAKTVILATGTGIVKPKRLPFSYSTSFEKTNLHYEVKDIKKFKNKKVMISGGNDSAVQWAKTLSDVAEHVYLVYRKDLFRGYEIEVQEVLSHEKITCLTEMEITGLQTEDNYSISVVEVTENVTGKQQDFIIDELLVCHGFEKNNPLVKAENNSLALIDDIFFEATEKGQTSVKNIFVAGDAASYEGKVKLIAGAFHDAVNASNGVKVMVDPAASDRGQVSSHHDVLKERHLEKVKK
ncbi:NAD(P)/FAD-dependent oxidoreductase [Vagococcus hydrophili]|uniref:Ferredoxin--NADP reductase n=1 Tax=Vagococcus hydrophili TaxID=2714947 RepID=A0A6G8ATF4_9ENTE|nr:NAD(P)/FAD-dependent oxidoreductase [Vagococcus hydrophili]QIL48249.1 NAD(P)/FAD-dependent oxidoreductase [Vagococcus hydrophili]